MGRSVGPRRLVALLALLTLAVFVVDTSSADETQNASAESERPLNILVISSWFENMPWHVGFYRGLRDGMAQSPRRIEMSVEFMDAPRVSDSGPREQWLNGIAVKYRDRDIDVVVAESIPAVQQLSAAPNLFPGARRIYSQTGAELAAEFSDQAVITQVDFSGAISEMLRMTNARHVVILGDTADRPGMKRLAALKQGIAAVAGDVATTDLTNLPLKELQERVSTLPEQSAIFLLPLFDKAGDGPRVTPRQAAGVISSAAAVPTFSAWETMLGTGLIGGYMLSSERIGRIVAQRIRWPQGVTDEAGRLTSHGFYYDWRELQRWNISEEKLPPGAVIRHRVPSTFETYGWQIITGLAVATVLVLIALSAVLLRWRRHRD